MKVGDYVRTYDGIIGKIIDKNMAEVNDRYELDYNNKLYNYQQIVKSSSNIIDLIEAGDYVNGGRVVEHAYESGRLFVENVYVGGKGQTTIENYSYELNSKYCYDDPDFVRTILTKEQFDRMEYKVGE